MPRLVSRLLGRSPDFAARLPRPRFLPRFLAVVASGTVLVLIARSFAGHPTNLPSWLDWLVTQIRHVTAGVPAVFGKDAEASSVIGARIEFFVVALAVIIALRSLVFWWLTMRPGPIQVSHLQDTTTDEASTDKVSPYVTMALREKLSGVSVYLPTPTPGDAVGGGFLQTMRESTRDSWWASAIQFVSRIIPSSAYRVDGAVLRRPGADDSYGVSVRVTVLPRQRTVANTVWAATPEQAAACAARVVAAAVLPLTRRCLASPWRHWYGRSLPVELLEEYEAASACREQRRYDEALGHYQAALDRDSLNPLIRLEMAQLQEQLGLYLDALATYASALALWSGSPERYNSWLHGQQVDGTGRRRFTAWQRMRRWRRYGNPFPTRYRYALALAYFEKLVPQWVKPEANDPRSRERARLRHLLVKTLAERYGPVWRPDERAPNDRRSKVDHLHVTLTDLTKQAQSEVPQVAWNARARLKRMFLAMSRYELQKLVRDHRSWLGWADDSDLTTRSLKLARDSWIDVRQAVAAHGLDDNGTAPTNRTLDRLLTRLPAQIDRTTRSSTAWMDHYNAACVYGQALVLVRGTERHRTLARAAVKELFAGLESADTAQVSRQRSWILSEDADLRELRRYSEFQPFVAAIGPAGGTVVLRPRRTQIAELSEYQTRLLRECAHTMESRWQERNSRLDVAELERQDWLDDDAHAWWRVHQLAIGHRNWPDRLAAIDYFRKRPAGASPWQVALPDIATFSPAEADRAGTDDRIAEEVDEWSDALIARGNLCEILVALWIRQHFRIDTAGRRFIDTNASDDCVARAGRWRQLREVVAAGQASWAGPVCREDALSIIDTANATLSEKASVPRSRLQEPNVDWEALAWRWAEDQRLGYPNHGSELEKPAAALARAFAALAIAYEKIGDTAMPLEEAQQLVGNLSPLAVPPRAS